MSSIELAYLDDQVIPFKKGLPKWTLFIETDIYPVLKKFFNELDYEDFDEWDNEADEFFFKDCFQDQNLSYIAVAALVKMFGRFLQVPVSRDVFNERKSMMYWLNQYIEEIKEFTRSHTVMVKYEGVFYQIRPKFILPDIKDFYLEGL